ncbi:MAG: hypothetical protein KF687_05745 [Cyclobacteriaceae bacterium]|nr:hypothetical protein [Cyclobacteriaceae bacterium]
MVRMRWVFTLILLLHFFAGRTQHQDPSWSARRAIINQQCIENDSLCNVLHKLGTFEGHVRNFFMSTINHQDFPDYFAWGIGGGLGYYSPIIKNFQVGMSGFIIYNMASSNLSPQPPFFNRYEVGLFDVTNPDNHEDLDRLEDLYIRYYISQENKSYFQVGKFHLRTPLINLQDGRMRPNLQEGAWLELNEWEKIKFKSGLLWRTSPRGTIHWYGIGNSVGVYPMGRAVNGERADYAGNVSTQNVFIGQVELIPLKGVNYQLWNYYADNLFNLALQKAEFRKKTATHTWMGGMQYLWQNSVFNDTLSVEKQYIGEDEQSHSLSFRASVLNNRTSQEWNLNYTRITSHGRFLFPREWGVESFYTFMQRERIEGMGDVHAMMVQNNRMLDKQKHLSLQTGFGMYVLPSLDDARFNKYVLPSFYQMNMRMRYKFTGFLQGLQADFLYLYKGNMVSGLEEIPQYYHNKVDMHHLSLVLDYYF